MTKVQMEDMYLQTQRVLLGMAQVFLVGLVFPIHTGECGEK